MSRLGHLAAIVLEREQSQMQLQSKSTIDQLIVENAANAILVILRDGTILKTNPQCRRLLGYTAAEFSQLNFGDLLVDQTSCSGLLPCPEPSIGTTHRVGKILATKSGSHLHSELNITYLTKQRLLILIHDQSSHTSLKPDHGRNPSAELLQKLATCTAEQINQALASIASHRDLLVTQMALHPNLEKDCQ